RMLLGDWGAAYFPHLASMGPLTFVSGCLAAWLLAVRSGQGFNGAAHVRARMHYRPTTCWWSRLSASMGPLTFVSGCVRSFVPAPAALPGFNGAAHVRERMPTWAFWARARG